MYCWFILKCVVFVETQHLNDSGFLDIFINCNQAMKNATTKSWCQGQGKTGKFQLSFLSIVAWEISMSSFCVILRQAWKTFLFTYSQAHHNWYYIPLKLNSKGNVLENYFICVDILVILRWCQRKCPFSLTPVWYGGLHLTAASVAPVSAAFSVLQLPW